jgi:tellurite resistance protein
VNSVKNEVIRLYLDVAMWVALGDGELAHAEKALIYRRLEDKFPHYIDLKNDFDNGVADFLSSFEESVSTVRSMIKESRQLHHIKDDLLEFAMKVVRDDGKLTEQEEFAIDEIQKLLS